MGSLRNSEAFASYKSIWSVSSLLITYGFLPLRGEFFNVIKEKVWHKSKETLRRLPNQLLEREFIVLKELTLNGIKDFTEIDNSYNFSPGTAQYTYHKLFERGIIRRITITMNKPPIKYIAILHLDQVSMNLFAKTRKDLFIDRVGATKTPLNKYILTGDYGSPYGIVIFAPIFENNGLEVLEENLREKVKGVKIRSVVITNILVGKLGFRKFDNKYTKSYEVLKEDYKLTEEELVRIIY